ncbi:MAG: MGMT family protein [Verrucomicrobiota bacterium]
MKISYAQIYDIVRKIPPGRVASYGQIAALAGYPRHPRQIGYALAALNDDSVPWQRVVNAKGEISPRTNSDGDVIQRILLEEEGVEFNENGRIALSRFRWVPKDENNL